MGIFLPSYSVHKIAFLTQVSLFLEGVFLFQARFSFSLNTGLRFHAIAWTSMYAHLRAEEETGISVWASQKVEYGHCRCIKSPVCLGEN